MIFRGALVAALLLGLLAVSVDAGRQDGNTIVVTIVNKTGDRLDGIWVQMVTSSSGGSYSAQFMNPSSTKIVLGNEQKKSWSIKAPRHRIARIDVGTKGSGRARWKFEYKGKGPYVLK